MCEPWRVSLHGGHSGAFCDHAGGSLRSVLQAAVEAGMHTYGVSEHAPRLGERYLYSAEIEKGWSVATLQTLFRDYAAEVSRLADEFSDRLVVLRGFETEVVPPDEYAEIMLGLRERHGFDYIVGSVHHVSDLAIDGSPTAFSDALAAHGNMVRLATAYYRDVERMVYHLQPEVVAHLDVIRKNARRAGFDDGWSDETEVRQAAEGALAAVRSAGAILDVNTAGYRKGLGHPYPARDLVAAAADMGIPFCFGDDSHGPAQVGEGIADARDYLVDCGVDSITVLARNGSELVHREIALR